VKNNNELYVLAKPRLNVLEGEFEIIKEILGQELIGTKYEAYIF